MTIQNLRYIIEIARCHSISKAAKSLFMTQSAISNAVKETEAELGIQIFNRTSHGVTLTFAVRAYRSFIADFQDDSFELSLWELPVKEIFHDVNSGRSEIGVFLFRDDQVPDIRKSLYLHDLSYTELAQPCVCISIRKRLAYCIQNSRYLLSGGFL